MANLVFWLIVFVVSLAVLIKSSDYFTDAAEEIGKYFGLPPFIIGVTIVAIGTSLPELASSILAVMGGSSEIVIGNVVGSNITNICLVLGLSAIIGKKMKIAHELIHVDLPLLFGSAALLGLCVMDGNFSFSEALICLGLLVVYLSYTVKSEKSDKEIKKELGKQPKKQISPMTYIGLVISVFFIYLGAKYTITSVVNLSQILNIATNIIAVTAVALGTSLPELVVSLTAARKGKCEIAVGNILGSNIFNALAVMGFSGLFGNLIIPQEILFFSLPMMIVATLLYYFITQDKEITRWEGWMLFIFYIFFIGSTFGFL